MALNLKYIVSRSGILKILHLVFGAIALGCGGHSLFSEYIFERYFLGAVIACFAITFINLIVHMLIKSLQGVQLAKLIDFIYQIIGGILLIVAGSLLITSGKKYDKDHCKSIPPGWDTFKCQNLSEKLAGGSFAIINAVFYFIAAASVAVDKDDTEDFENYSKNYGYDKDYGKTTAVKSRHSEEPEDVKYQWARTWAGLKSFLAIF